MTREEAKRRVELYTAMVEGKTIQIKNSNGTWEDVKIEELYDVFDYNKYRIKPESKCRPFKNKEECWQEMLKHQPFGWVIGKINKDFYNIDFVYSCNPDNGYGVRLNYYGEVYTKYENMFKGFTFADGEPFGIKEE